MEQAFELKNFAKVVRVRTIQPSTFEVTEHVKLVTSVRLDCLVVGLAASVYSICAPVAAADYVVLD